MTHQTCQKTHIKCKLSSNVNRTQKMQVQKLTFARSRHIWTVCLSHVAVWHMCSLFLKADMNSWQWLYVSSNCWWLLTMISWRLTCSCQTKTSYITHVSDLKLIFIICNLKRILKTGYSQLDFKENYFSFRCNAFSYSMLIYHLTKILA